MGKKHLNKSSIAASNTAKNERKYINNDPTRLHDWSQEGNNAMVFVSLRHLQHDHECFSDWSKVEMKTFWNFMDKVHQYTWQDLLSSGGKSQKTGLGYTVIPLENYPDSIFRKDLDPLINIFELRVDQKSRVHCFRHKSVCYICWLDKNHAICPS